MWPYLEEKSHCKCNYIRLGRSRWGCHGLTQVGPRANRKQRGWVKTRVVGSSQKPQVAWKGSALTASGSSQPASTFIFDASRPMVDYFSVLTNHSGCSHQLCQLALLYHTERKSGLPAVDSGNSFNTCLPLCWAHTQSPQAPPPPAPCHKHFFALPHTEKTLSCLTACAPALLLPS